MSAPIFDYGTSSLLSIRTYINIWIGGYLDMQTDRQIYNELSWDGWVDEKMVGRKVGWIDY